MLSDRFRTFRKKDYSTFNLNEMTESECLSELIDLEKETFRCNTRLEIFASIRANFFRDRAKTGS